MNVQICIYTLAGAPLCLQSMGTIWQLKLQIKEDLGVPRRLQRLFSETREVANCEDIRDDCVLTRAITNSCCICGKQSTKSCSRCFSACYCCVQCQTLDWGRHKSDCNPVAQDLLRMMEIKKEARTMGVSCSIYQKFPYTVRARENKIQCVSCCT